MSGTLGQFDIRSLRQWEIGRLAGWDAGEWGHSDTGALGIVWIRVYVYLEIFMWGSAVEYIYYFNI